MKITIKKTNYWIFPGIDTPEINIQLRGLNKELGDNIIIKIISEICEIPISEIFKKSRKLKYTEARQFYYFFMKKYSSYSLLKISQNANRNHSSVIHGIKQLKNHIDTEIDIRKKFNKIDDKISIFKKTNKNEK